MGSRGEAPVEGLGTNPVECVGYEVPQKLTTFFGLKVFFTQNTPISSYFKKLDCSFSHF